MTPVEALQRTLAAEHAAVHLLGSLGGVTSVAEAPRLAALLRDRFGLHRGRREHLVVMIRNAGETPVAAFPAYELPEAVSPEASPRAVRRAAAVVERACAETYATQVASTTREDREWAVMALAESAGALVRLGDEPEAFPGAPEFAARADGS